MSTQDGDSEGKPRKRKGNPNVPDPITQFKVGDVVQPGFFPNPKGETISDSGPLGRTARLGFAVVRRVAFNQLWKCNVDDIEIAASDVAFTIHKTREGDPRFLARPIEMVKYLYGAFHNILLDLEQARLAAEERYRDLDAAANVPIELPDSLMLDKEGKGFGSLLAREISQLPPRLRAAAELRFLKLMPYKEVARILGISFETADEYIGIAAERLRPMARAYLQGDL